MEVSYMANNITINESPKNYYLKIKIRTQAVIGVVRSQLLNEIFNRTLRISMSSDISLKCRKLVKCRRFHNNSDLCSL